MGRDCEFGVSEVQMGGEGERRDYMDDNKETDRQRTTTAFPSALTHEAVLRERLLVIIHPRRVVRVIVRVQVPSPTQSKEAREREDSQLPAKHRQMNEQPKLTY